MAGSVESENRRQALAEAIKDDAWRLSLASYAATASSARRKWKPYPWIRYVADLLQSRLRKGNARLILNAPPRHGKSELVSHWLPVWYLDWYPENRVIAACYGDALANNWGRLARDELIMNPLCWTKVRQDTQAVNDWRTTAGGGMRTAGVGGPLVGLGANLVVIDDPHKNWEDAMSPASRQRLIDWFNAVLYTRLEPDASIVVIHTRWVERDLTGYLLNEHPDKWERIRLPALAEANDPIGRRLNEPLCADRYPAKALDQIKAAMPPQMFAGLYQQRPGPLEGAIIKRADFRHYDKIPAGIECLKLSFDLTFDVDGTSLTTGACWGRKGPNFYLLDLERDNVGFDGQLAMIKRMKDRWPSAAVYIEKKANGAAAITTVKNTIAGVMPVEPHGSKVARLMAVQPFFGGGNVWLPAATTRAWVGDYIEELVGFPMTEHDDQVDVTSQALLLYRQEDADLANATGEGLDLDLSFGARESPWRF